MAQKRIVFIVGPTAVGKTAVSLILARMLNSEIVNADAMQIYREVKILNNKPDPQALRKVVHHLIGTRSVDQLFDVAAYNKEARKAIRAIHNKGKIPLIVGGSGLYVRVLLDGIFAQESDAPVIRQRLEQEVRIKGPQWLYNRLKQVDTQAAQRIHPNDVRRIVRALEVYESQKQPISKLQKNRSGLWDQHDIALLGLNMQRQDLIDRINQRVEHMIREGAVEEVRSLSKRRLSRTAQGMIGIKEIQGHLDGVYDLERAQDLIKLHTRQYAKRQMTWFRQEKRLQWVTVKSGQSPDKIAGNLMNEMDSCFRQKKIMDAEISWKKS